tara:strand:+ start:133 stop:432 length:300 start_codon:yes stop_codon:yes gene_type:complete
MALDEFTDKQLQEELARREELRKQQLREERKERAEFLSQHIDLLLLLMPEHSRTSCSDKNPCNEHRGCVRCNLIYAKDSNCWPENTELSISVRELPLLD